MMKSIAKKIAVLGAIGVMTLAGAESALAAENEIGIETTVKTQFYNGCSRQWVEDTLEYYKQFGTEYMVADGTHYLRGDGVTYEITYTDIYYKTDSYYGAFRTEEQALEYGISHGWENVYAYEVEPTEEWSPYKYAVSGERMLGDLIIKTIPDCCPTESLDS